MSAQAKPLWMLMVIRIAKHRDQVFADLSAQQKVQLSRHPGRPFMLDYIREHQPGTFLRAWAMKFLPMLFDVELVKVWP